MKYALLVLFILAGLVFFTRYSAAATTTLNAIINSGTLTITNPSIATISAVNLEGTAQASTGSLGSVTVTDNRGTGMGWSVTAAVSDFSCCTPLKTITADNLQIDPGMLTAVTGKTAGVTAGNTHKFSSSEDPATLMTAVTGSGMGSYRVTPSISLAIPPDAYAGTYTATIIITII